MSSIKNPPTQTMPFQARTIRAVMGDDLSVLSLRRGEQVSILRQHEGQYWMARTKDGEEGLIHEHNLDKVFFEVKLNIPQESNNNNNDVITHLKNLNNYLMESLKASETREMMVAEKLRTTTAKLKQSEETLEQIQDLCRRTNKKKHSSKSQSNSGDTRPRKRTDDTKVEKITEPAPSKRRGSIVEQIQDILDTVYLQNFEIIHLKDKMHKLEDELSRQKGHKKAPLLEHEIQELEQLLNKKSTSSSSPSKLSSSGGSLRSATIASILASVDD